MKWSNQLSRQPSQPQHSRQPSLIADITVIEINWKFNSVRSIVGRFTEPFKRKKMNLINLQHSQKMESQAEAQGKTFTS